MISLANLGCDSSTCPLAHGSKLYFSTKISSSYSTTERLTQPVRTQIPYLMSSMESCTVTSVRGLFELEVGRSITSISRTNVISHLAYPLTVFPFSREGTCLHGLSS